LKPNPSGALLVRDAKDKGVASETPKVLVMLPLSVPTTPLSLIGKSLRVKKRALKD
jgi:hypothetical protein